LPPAPVSSLTPGCYGKLPSRGDFVSWHLPPGFVKPWDDWLQTAIAHSRQQLESTWLECYLTSPLWRFALSPGACGEDAYAGVLMPSVDRVGRYFPLTIAAPLSHDQNFLELTGTDWFERAEEAALAGLNEHLDPENLVERVRTLGLPYTSKSLGTVWLTEDAAGPGWHCALGDLAKLNGVGNELADQLLRWRFPQYTLWWSHGSERIAPCLLICQGLPHTQGFAALLAGDWKRWGWSERPLASQSLIL